MTTKNYKGYALTDDGIKHFLRDHRHKKFEHLAPTIKREATKLQKAMAQIVKAVDATVSAAEQARLRKPLTGMERLRKWLRKLHSELKSQAVAQKEYRRIDGQRRRNGIGYVATERQAYLAQTNLKPDQPRDPVGIA